MDCSLELGLTARATTSPGPRTPEGESATASA